MEKPGNPITVLFTIRQVNKLEPYVPVDSENKKPDVNEVLQKHSQELFENGIIRLVLNISNYVAKVKSKTNCVDEAGNELDYFNAVRGEHRKFDFEKRKAESLYFAKIKIEKSDFDILEKHLFLDYSQNSETDCTDLIQKIVQFELDCVLDKCAEKTNSDIEECKNRKRKYPFDRVLSELSSSNTLTYEEAIEGLKEIKPDEVPRIVNSKNLKRNVTNHVCKEIVKKRSVPKDSPEANKIREIVDIQYERLLPLLYKEKKFKHELRDEVYKYIQDSARTKK